MLRYKEIKQKLIDIISDMREGERLPSRPVLCTRLDTTRTTLDKAIRELVEEGALTASNGSGTYVTSALGRSTEHEGYWGIIIPNIMEPIYAGIVRGIENTAQNLGVNVTLCNSDNDAEKQQQYIHRLLHSGVSGFIMVPVISRNVRENIHLYERLTEAKIPFVFCNRTVDGITAPVVTSDDFYGSYIGTKYLLEKGYQKIAFISQIKYSTSENRCHGYLTAIMEKGLPVERRNIIMEEEPNSFPTGYLSMKRLLEQDPGIDAVFCFNDRIAQGVYQAIEESGRRVSDDIGVIGYDNTSEICERLTPRLSSLSYKNVEIGQKAAELLWKLIQHQPVSAFDYYLMQPSIVERDSCRGKR